MNGGQSAVKNQVNVRGSLHCPIHFTAIKFHYMFFIYISANVKKRKYQQNRWWAWWLRADKKSCRLRVGGAQMRIKAGRVTERAAIRPLRAPDTSLLSSAPRVSLPTIALWSLPSQASRSFTVFVPVLVVKSVRWRWVCLGLFLCCCSCCAEPRSLPEPAAALLNIHSRRIAMRMSVRFHAFNYFTSMSALCTHDCVTVVNYIYVYKL